MKGFYIEITNNLLDPKHRKAIGSAIWEFMWCLDKITKIDDDHTGWVYAGKPINLVDIRSEIGITESKISKNLRKLERGGYIKLKKTPYGLIIGVARAKKRFAQKGNTERRELPLRTQRIALKDTRIALKGNANKTRQGQDIRNIYMSYKTKINERSLLTLTGKKLVVAALKHFTPEQIIKIIETKAKDEWFMENNAKRGFSWFFNRINRLERYLEEASEAVCIDHDWAKPEGENFKFCLKCGRKENL